MKNLFKCSLIALTMLICSSFASNNQAQQLPQASQAQWGEGTGTLLVEMNGSGSIEVFFETPEGSQILRLGGSASIPNIRHGSIVIINAAPGYTMAIGGSTIVYAGQTSIVYVTVLPLIDEF